MESTPIFTRSRKSGDLLSQPLTKSRIDQSMELRYLPSSFLRLGRVSLRVTDRRLDCRIALDLGCNSRTEWSDNPKGGMVFSKVWSYKLGMFVIMRSSVWSPLVGQRTSCFK